MNNMKEVKSPKKPVLMYYVIIFLLVILFNSAVMPAWREQQVKEVDYSTFMNLTDEKKIDKVEVDEDQILFIALGPSESRGERVISAIGQSYIRIDPPCYVA